MSTTAGEASSAVGRVDAVLEASLDLAAGRDITRRSRGWRDDLSAAALGGGFAIAAIGLAVSMPSSDWSWRVAGVLAVLTACYAAAYWVEFESALGSFVPTEPVLVVALFLMPIELVPAMVLIAYVASLAWATPGAPRLRTLAVRCLGGWHCLGPVAVFLLADVHDAQLDRWPVYLAALLSQFALDAGAAALRCLGTGVPVRELVTPLSFTFGADALLAPLGFAAAVAGGGKLGALPLVGAVVVLIAVLSRDRRVQVDSSVALGEAVVVARSEARLDVLTGLANRRAWEEAVEQAQSTLLDPVDARVTVTIVLADLDGLKHTNDTDGHHAGDELIRALGALLAEHAPEGAVAARVGGDEFALLVVSPLGHDVGADLVARLRAGAAAVTLASGRPLSVSFGAASCPPELSIHQAYRTADKAVFTDKSSRWVERRRSTDVAG